MPARRIVLFLVPLLAVLIPVVPTASAGRESATRRLVFSGEGNRLNVYDAATGDKQTLIPSNNEGGLDINAQVCFQEFGDATYFIAGEDTFQDADGEPGWGWFELQGDRVGELSAIQRGKLVPTYSGEDQAENYGCGFLRGGRLVTSDVGDQLPHQEASGQLVVWFADPATGFNDATDDDGDIHTIDNSLDTDYCKVDTDLGTAGGVWVDRSHVYVASNRPGLDGPGGIYRYPIADLPADTDCEGHDRDDDLVNEGAVAKELWLPSDAFALTPSAIVPSGRTWNGFPTWYVSSVFTGVVAEYADTGAARVHVRNLVEPPGGLPIGQIDDIPINDAGTPFGIGISSDGSELWYADLGIQGDGPADGHGSVQRVTIDSQGNPQRLVVDDGLDFPDGIGVLEIGVTLGKAKGSRPATSDRHASSQSGCGDWRMYGRSGSRTFSVPDGCSRIDATTVGTLVPTWVVKTEKTVTASPAVAGGRVFVGDWSAHMYAVDADDGTLLWKKGPFAAPGAAFGPIVSSAAVARVDGTDLVIFGAGPNVVALRADDGTTVWTQEVDFDPTPLPADTPVEVESSPVVWRGAVYVGMDNHNNGGTGVRGGLLALDATDGHLLWKFEPELDHGDEGCGGVWSSPTLDTAHGRVYLGTANCPSDAFSWTPHTEAITALDAGTGEVEWSFQPHTPNRKDWDFGATPNLFTSPAGRKVLGAGNKDGSYYALDPRTGSLLWRTKVADGGDVDEDFAIGGFIGSPAAHRGRVYGGTAIGGPPYYHALDGTDGSIEWRGAQAPSYAASAAVNGVVFSGALDDVLRAYDAQTGIPLWAAPLLGPISSGPAIVGDAVYVGSGTSSSDACAKELPVNEQCQALFDQVLGSLGGIHAFELAL